MSTHQRQTALDIEGIIVVLFYYTIAVLCRTDKKYHTILPVFNAQVRDITRPIPYYDKPILASHVYASRNVLGHRTLRLLY